MIGYWYLLKHSQSYTFIFDGFIPVSRLKVDEKYAWLENPSLSAVSITLLPFFSKEVAACIFNFKKYL